jgi:hypothetical protein
MKASISGSLAAEPLDEIVFRDRVAAGGQNGSMSLIDDWLTVDQHSVAVKNNQFKAISDHPDPSPKIQRTEHRARNNPAMLTTTQTALSESTTAERILMPQNVYYSQDAASLPT